MTDARRFQVTATGAVVTALFMLAAGAGGTYLLMRREPVAPGGSADAPASPAASVPAAAAPSPTQARSGEPLPDVPVTLGSDAVERAGIRVTSVAARAATESLRVPGVVEPNAYRQVAVTPLVGGRVVRVSAQLGDHVRKGAPLAAIYSPELAEARTKYITAQAMLEAHDRERQRTERLVEIGAASRQELERVHAEHAAQTAEVESARSRLQLLGADPGPAAPSNAADAATTTVRAPIDGVVTERGANVGLNVDPTMKLFTIVDLSSVWIVGEVYERDLQRVREGTPARIVMAGEPGRPLDGRVSFIEPQLSAATRTARVRVEVANPRGDLRLGMYADVVIAAPDAAPVLTVPREAVQNVGDRQVVYVSVPGDRTKFLERDARLGRVLGDQVEVLGGLSAGDSVVSSGSFFLRAEAERLGLRSSQPAAPAAAKAGPAAAEAPVAKVTVTEHGFEPDKVDVRAGQPARITFVRTTDKTCATEIAFPSLNIKRPLPLNEPVVVEFTPAKSGEVTFVCGMNMLKGTVVVQ
jgi:RND family efflux transporter MFP subunit